MKNKRFVAGILLAAAFMTAAAFDAQAAGLTENDMPVNEVAEAEKAGSNIAGSETGGTEETNNAMGENKAAEADTENLLDQLNIPSGFTEFSAENISRIQDFLDGMEIISTDYRTDYMQFRIGTGTNTSLLDSFSIYDPTVELEKVNFELEDLTAAANWSIYDMYQFQIGSMADYTEKTPINPEKTNAFFKDEWQEVKSFDFGGGFARTQDTCCCWIPVFYRDEAENIYENTLYLFVYIIHTGADKEYLSDKIFYAHYGEFRTEKLLIADDGAIADFLKAIQEENDIFVDTEDTTEYVTLSKDYNGEMVRKLQMALFDAGFLTSSVDGYYGPLTQEAVSACQESMELEVTGNADADLQRRLFSDSKEKNEIQNWLETHE